MLVPVSNEIAVDKIKAIETQKRIQFHFLHLGKLFRACTCKNGLLNTARDYQERKKETTRGDGMTPQGVQRNDLQRTARVKV